MDSPLESMIRRAVRPVQEAKRRLDRGRYSFETPKTEFQKLLDGAASFVAEWQALTEEEKEQSIRVMLEDSPGQALSLPALLREEHSALPRGKRVRLVCNYLAQVDSEIPYLPYMLFGDLCASDVPLASLHLAIARLEQASRGRGEKRSNALEAATKQVTEYAYQPYVDVLYKMEYLRQPRRPQITSKFAKRHTRVVEWTERDFPGLIHPLVINLRNAASHAGRWSFVLETESVDLANSGGWQASYALPEIYAHLRSLVVELILSRQAWSAISPRWLARLLRECDAVGLARAWLASRAVDREQYVVMFMARYASALSSVVTLLGEFDNALAPKRQVSA